MSLTRGAAEKVINSPVANERDSAGWPEIMPGQLGPLLALLARKPTDKNRPKNRHQEAS